jgi:hypothetical protein
MLSRQSTLKVTAKFPRGPGTMDILTVFLVRWKARDSHESS